MGFSNYTCKNCKKECYHIDETSETFRSQLCVTCLIEQVKRSMQLPAHTIGGLFDTWVNLKPLEEKLEVKLLTSADAIHLYSLRVDKHPGRKIVLLMEAALLLSNLLPESPSTNRIWDSLADIIMFWVFNR